MSEETVHGACFIVVKRNPADGMRALVLGIEGPKGTGLPGGRIELGESPLSAAVRELNEETGLTLDPWAVPKHLEVRATDNGDIAHGFTVSEIYALGPLRASKEGNPVWLKPIHLVVSRLGKPPVRFPEYNKWALQTLGLIDGP